MTSRFGLFVLGPVVAWGAQTGAPPVQLPPVEVKVPAPLVKVAEYKMREPRFGAAAVAVGDNLFIVGGSNRGNWVLDSVERLDCRTGVSEPFARLQRGRIWQRVVVVGQTMYVLGGATVETSTTGRLTQHPDDSVELVDLTNGKISRGPDLPEPLRSFACVLVGERIFVIGGVLRTEARAGLSNRTWILDLKTNRWSKGTPMPTPREAEAVVVDGPFVVVPGGYNGVWAVAEVEFLNPRDGSWKTLPPLCRPTSAHALAFLGHQLFFFGDYDTPEQCLAYDLRTRQSELIAVPYKGARHAAAVVHRDRIYVIGGRNNDSPEALDVVQVFALRKQPAAPGR